MKPVYACIDLKSFYASVECVERKLNPLTTNLVVADTTRTEKTICLAITPPLKQYGLSGRARLYEVVQKIKELNRIRQNKIGKSLCLKSYNIKEINENDNQAIDFIIAPPRMKLYMYYSNKIYNIYLKYLSQDDIYVYSIDEVFLDLTNYLRMYQLEPDELVTTIIKDIYMTTGITATGGIGTNLYLSKIAMDIEAKRVAPNQNGVRIAYLDEISYRKKLWEYRPLTDFWRIGKGISKKLEQNNIFCMGDIAKCSLENENKLFRLFGINAELIIDHAWGYEPCTIKDIKNYKPKSNSLSKGQVLKTAYSFSKAMIIVKEMIENLVLQMIEHNYSTDCLVLYIGYDVSNLEKLDADEVDIAVDYYGRLVPKAAHGSERLEYHTSSLKLISEKMLGLYNKIVNPNLTIRRINLTVSNLKSIKKCKHYTKQFDLFHDTEQIDKEIKNSKKEENIDINLQKTILALKNKYGKNSILKGLDLCEGATTIERNLQVGGHQG